jgi:hypothetical protein
VTRDGRTRERGGSSLGRDPAGGQGESGSLPGVRAHVAEHLAPDFPKKRDHEDALQEERAQTAELRRRQEDLQESIARISSQKAQTETRLRKLRAPERARILEQRAATGFEVGRRAYELGIARDDIVARAVEPISKKAYRKLYREAAKRYGFGEDWYVLAAVAKVESGHGTSLGPSTAGAIAPMQFLPST